MEKGQIIGLTTYLGVVAAYMAMVSYGILIPMDVYTLWDYTPAQLVALVLFAVGIGIVIASIKNAGGKNLKDYTAAAGEFAQRFFGVDEKQLERLAKQVGRDVEKKLGTGGRIGGIVDIAKDTLGAAGAKVSRVARRKLGIQRKERYPTPEEFARDLQDAIVLDQVASMTSAVRQVTTDALLVRQIPIVPARPANVTSAEPEGTFVKRRSAYLYMIILFAVIGMFFAWLVGR